MKTIALALLALVLAETVVSAACPPGTRYSCSQGYGGKVICSCV